MKIKQVTVTRGGLICVPTSDLFNTRKKVLQYGLKHWLGTEGLIPERTRINCETSLNSGFYTVAVNFSPPVELVNGFVGRIFPQLNQLFGFNFGFGDDIHVFPAGLRTFRGNWGYMEKNYFFDEENTESSSIMRVVSVGNPNPEQVRGLREITDEVHLPRYDAGTRWNIDFSREDVLSFMGHGVHVTDGSLVLTPASDGDSYPVFAVDKKFEGEISADVEASMRQTYRQICSFILESGVTEKCVGYSGRIFSEDVKSIEGRNIRPEIARATAGGGKKYYPGVGVACFLPMEEQGLRVTNGKSISKTVKTLEIVNNGLWDYGKRQ